MTPNIDIFALTKIHNTRTRDKLSLRALSFFYPTFGSFHFFKHQPILKEEHVRTTLRNNNQMNLKAAVTQLLFKKPMKAEVVWSKRL